LLRGLLLILLLAKETCAPSKQAGPLLLLVLLGWLLRCAKSTESSGCRLPCGGICSTEQGLVATRSYNSK
jgi:hypothetical protein